MPRQPLGPAVLSAGSVGTFATPISSGTYVVPQGYGRFAIRCSRLATASGNFDKGNAHGESISPRKELTRLDREALYHHFHYGCPHCHEDDRQFQKYGNQWCSEEERGYAVGSRDNPAFRGKVERYRKALREKITGKREESPSRHKAGRIASDPSPCIPCPQRCLLPSLCPRVKSPSYEGLFWWHP